MLKQLPKRYQSFLDIDKIHRVADALLIEHQVCCMKGDWDTALIFIDYLYQLRICNMNDEEEFLLPLYVKILREIPQGGAVKFYLREHKLIRNKLDKFIHLVSKKALHPGETHISLVNLFEDYHRLKDLLDHHDARERAFLFKSLDEHAEKFDYSVTLKKIEIGQDDLLKRFENHA